ncbi:tyrosine-type recombinase/integrase [Nitrosomonas nitrosa]|uniref:tyrosine-type recombinase/integrase n=1 Tax=Nitrosomonas nitrosa TaxID=52442 RepID=UPI0023F6A147|nr:integrase arm-type DNA-binding domain-containing protein [Nitrosomonas nitrosa]MCO6435371.1 tyrosine-type recombinase/integrase [Nitrosomonas nitrosa]
MKLNDPIIKNAKPREKAYKLYDGKGLVLLVTPTGRKWWRYRYMYHGREKMLALGTYPDVPLSVARDLRDDAKKLLKQGIDPSQHRQEQKLARKIASQNTFESVARAWWSSWRRDKTTRHADAVLRRLEDNVFPIIGRKPIVDISAPLLIMTLKQVDQRGASDTARRIFNSCSRIFRYAISHGLAERNPAADVTVADIFQPLEKTNYARIGASELPQLLRDLDSYRGNQYTRMAFQLMLLTFVRTRELTEAEWSEIDWDARLWRIPAERMKKRTPHLVPLSDQALSILRTLHELSGDGRHLFQGQRDPSKPMSENTLIYALYRMGYKGQMTGHGFRGLASTILNEKGYPPKHIEIQLAHLVGNATRRAYDSAKHLDERTKMMQWWADYLDQMRTTIGTT